MAIPISQRHANCYVAFTELMDIAAKQAARMPPSTDIGDVAEEFDRYKLWAGNVGAAYSRDCYQLSLDYRLREASFYSFQVLKLLEILHKHIDRALSILSGQSVPFENLSFDSDSDHPHQLEANADNEAEESPWDISSESDEELSAALALREEQEQDHPHPKAPMHTPEFERDRKQHVSETLKHTEIGQLFNSIKLTITCLYKLPLRRPAPIDRLKDETTDQASCYQPFDVLYVMDKFPKLERSVAERLGKLITRRRQLLLYRKHHHESLKTDAVAPKLKLAVGETAQETPMEPDDSKTETTQRPKGQTNEITGTQAASVQQTLVSKATTHLLDELALMDATVLHAPSATEFNSLRAASRTTLDVQVEVPPRPKKDGRFLDRFECRYCLLVSYIRSDHAWKKHVLNDLQPYVCTFPNCSLFDHLFQDRNAWYRHELQKHRVEWFCNVEGHPQFLKKSDFLTHMGQDHGAILDTERLATLADIFTRPSAALGGICNLCFLSSTNLKLHVSRHLEQIVLFALPRSDYAAGDESIGGNSVDIHSNQSQKNVKGSVVEKEMLQSQPSGTAHTLSKDRDDRLGAAEAQDDDPPGEDIVHQIDVPDMVPSSWDDVTDKFSEARRGLSATAPFLERSTTAGYCNVAVLLIQWADETEERKKEIRKLDAVFRDLFGYSTKTVEIYHEHKPQLQLNLAVAEFVDKNGKPNSLLIVYYSGHTQWHMENSNLVLGSPTLSNKMRQLRFAAGWTMAERMLADDAEGDVLAIFDAVYATKVKRDIRSGNTRTFQVLAATGYNRSPIELRLQSFTASLIKVLKQSVNVEWDEPSITIYKLGEMIDRQEEPPETPCLIHTILKGSQQCISLGPLAPRPQDRLEFGALASERWKHATLVVRAIVKLRRRAVRSLARRRWKRAMLAVRTVVRWRIYIQQRDRLAPRLTQEAEEKAREEEKKKERERIRTENEEWERRRREAEEATARRHQREEETLARREAARKAPTGAPERDPEHPASTESRGPSRTKSVQFPMHTDSRPPTQVGPRVPSQHPSGIPHWTCHACGFGPMSMRLYWACITCGHSPSGCRLCVFEEI